MVVDVSDGVLVAAARRGDLDAFEVLVRRHQSRVFGLALRMLGSEQDAEDAAQEAFVQAWRSLARFRGDSSFSTWMYRIATNRCLNVIAARRPTEALGDVPGPASGGAADVVERRARTQALTEAVRTLPPEARAALVLREFQGLSYEEIAEVLGVSLAAVKGRIHRARLELSGKMTEWR